MAWTIISNNAVIPSNMIVADSIQFNVEEGTKERNTYSTKTKRPSGQLENNEVEFELYYDTPKDLKDIFPGMYNAPTGTQLIGNMVLAGASCTLANQKFVFHDDCYTTDDRDITFENATALLAFNTTLSVTEDNKVKVTVLGRNAPTLGTEDLTQPSYFDPITMSTKPAPAA